MVRKKDDADENYSRWNDFFTEYKYDTAIKCLASTYPRDKSVTVKYADIDDFDPEFAALLEDKPDATLDKGIQSMKGIIYPLMGDNHTNGMRVYLRVKELPRGARIGVRDIREKDLNKLIVVEGIAKRVTEVKPKALVAAFQCVRCGAITRVEQTTPYMEPPMECAKSNDGGGGCGRSEGSTRFKYVLDASELIDSQKIEVQERPEGLRGGSQPQSIVCRAYVDTCGMVTAGDKVIITGILRAVPKDQKHTTHETYIDVNHIELVDVETEEMEISPEERAEISRLSALDDIQEVLTDSICPSIFGHVIVKKALMLQLFNGVPKITPDGTRLRGDIHILLIGDPGTGKSQLLLYMTRLVPRGIYASGKSTSAAGLTACVTKDDFGEGRWTLEAGALVLADGGQANIDELDKMSKEDRSSMHEAMEQQTITINKASVHAALHCRCSVLAAANPKFGRFMPQQLIAEQIDLPPTLFSRFDLIFPITDKPNTEKDGNIADHILNSHLSGQAKKRLENSMDVAHNPRLDSAEKSAVPKVLPNILRKYVFIAKKLVPMLTEEAIVILKAYYQEVRSLGLDEGSPVPITARQLEGLVRLAEASAKSRMSEKVEARDAQVSISIVQEFLDRVVARGSSGGMDIDCISGTPKTQRDMMVAVSNVATRLSQGGEWSYREFEETCINEAGIPSTRIPDIFDKMVQNGEIYLKSTKDSTKRYLKV